jgi:hypothetical protein
MTRYRLKTMLCCCFAGVLTTGGTCFANPYCVSGANWSANGTMVNLGMPAESYGYIWDNLQTTNVPNMVRPCRYWQLVGVAWQRYWGYLHETDEIYDPVQFGNWVDANPGKIWIIGNEPDLGGQDGLTREQYAAMFHTYYTFVSARDASAEFAVAALSGDAVPGNVGWDISWWEYVLDYYQTTYGEQMPVDIWNFHCYASGSNRDAQYVFDIYIDPFVDWVNTVDGGVYSDCEIWCTEFGVGFWHSFINAEWVAPFMHRYCLLFEQSEVDRWFWFLGPWDNWSGDWQQTCLLDVAQNPTVLGDVYSDLANNYPNLTATPMPDPATSVCPDLFADDFDDGNDDGWIRKAGNWNVEDGEYRIRDHPGWWGLFSEIPYIYQDFSMEADVKINAASEDVNWAGFYFRFPLMFGDRSDGGYLVYIRQNGELGLHNQVDGTVMSVPGAVADTAVFHRLKVECVGQPADITVYVDDSQLFSWTDPNGRFDSGFVALEAGHSDCSFDNVRIENLGTSKVSENWRFY